MYKVDGPTSKHKPAHAKHTFHIPCSVNVTPALRVGERVLLTEILSARIARLKVVAQISIRG